MNAVPPPDVGVERRFSSWPRRALGFSAGVAVVWLPLWVHASGGASWVLLIALAGLWFAVVRAIRGFTAAAWGILAGIISFIAVLAIIWTIWTVTI